MAAKILRGQTIKRFTSVHSWIGICTGMALFIAFYCGAFVVYEHELHLWANPGLRGGFGDTELVDKLVNETAEDPASKGNFSISLGEDGQGPIKATFFEFGEGRKFVAHTRAFNEEMEIVPQQTSSSLVRFINGIHFTLGIPGSTGYNLMGIVSLVYALALITGLIIHLPHLLRDLFALRTGKNLKKMWMDAHNVIGVLSLPFHLMFAITGMVFCLTFTISEVLPSVMPSSQAYTEYRAIAGFKKGGGRREAAAPQAQMIAPAELIALAREQAPDMLVTGISYRNYGTEKAVATVRGRFHGAIIAKGGVELSATDGRVILLDMPGERHGAKQLNSGYIELHIGNFAGSVGKFIYFVLGIAGAFLFYSGNLLWVETRRKSRSTVQPRRGWIMAQLTVGICLGCCLGVGLSLAANKIIGSSFVDRDLWEQNFYFVGFFGSAIWALARTPARASVDLLFACAAVYACLPILNWSTTGVSMFGTGFYGAWESLLIDVLLAAAALSFFAMAQATRRRAKLGQTNSVWSQSSTFATADSPASTNQASTA